MRRWKGRERLDVTRNLRAGRDVGLPIYQERPTSPTSAPSPIGPGSEGISRSGSGFRFNDPHIDGFSEAVLGLRDDLISTMNGLVCFAIGPPTGESMRYDSVGIDRGKPLRFGVFNQSRARHQGRDWSTQSTMECVFILRGASPFFGSCLETLLATHLRAR
jgi:hypothetical protein